jgi:multidrug resistance efflux pump
LLADVNPTFNWVRLAQRVPVRIDIDETSIPADVVLAAGMTASIDVQPRRVLDRDSNRDKPSP